MNVYSLDENRLVAGVPSERSCVEVVIRPNLSYSMLIDKVLQCCKGLRITSSLLQLQQAILSWPASPIHVKEDRAVEGLSPELLRKWDQALETRPPDPCRCAVVDCH